MILGDICTRSCGFCNVKTGKPLPPNPSEPAEIALTIREMKLMHCVITSVDRDDLPDGGAAFWNSVINEIKSINPGITIEALVPDFQGDTDSLREIINAKPDIISHNLETVERLTTKVRKKAIYRRSLSVLEYFSKSGIRTKSGIMVGLGENETEVFQTMDDLILIGVRIFTIGQYLQPSTQHLPVKAYIDPDVFAAWKEIGLSKGFEYVESGPFVRSSYHAANHL